MQSSISPVLLNCMYEKLPPSAPESDIGVARADSKLLKPYFMRAEEPTVMHMRALRVKKCLMKRCCPANMCDKQLLSNNHSLSISLLANVCEQTCAMNICVSKCTLSWDK